MNFHIDNKVGKLDKRKLRVTNYNVSSKDFDTIYSSNNDKIKKILWHVLYRLKLNLYKSTISKADIWHSAMKL